MEGQNGIIGKAPNILVQTLKDWRNKGLPLMKMTLSQVFLSRKTALVVLLCLIPFFVILVLLNEEPDGGSTYAFFSDASNYLYMVFILPLITLFYGTGIIHEEIENKTFIYLDSRPMYRSQILVYKYVATVAAVVSIIVFFLSLCFAALHAGRGGGLENIDVLGAYIMVFIPAICAYIAFFMLLGVMFKKPLMPGLLFAFIWEYLIGNLPGRIPMASLVFYNRSLTYRLVDVGEITMFENPATLGGAIAVLLGISITALSVAGLILESRNLE